MTTQIEEDMKKKKETRQYIEWRRLKRNDQAEYRAEEMENDQAKYRAEEDYKKKLLGRIEEIERNWLSRVSNWGEWKRNMARQCIASDRIEENEKKWRKKISKQNGTLQFTLQCPNK